MILRLNPLAFALAGAVAAAILWTLCSLMVLALPALALDMTGHMLHAQLGSFGWTLTWTGFLVGLVAWSVWTAIAGWLLAFAYNLLLRGA